MTRKQHLVVILILGALATISPFSIDMYLPGFPSIAKDLNTTIDQVQLSLTSYLIGIAIGQLLYGPLLDRFGRRAPLYAGLAVYILASIGCSLTHSIHALIIMRFLQALGGCAGMVASQALVRDLFPIEKTAQAFSSLTLVIAVSPLIAPTIGGYVTVAFGWQFVFVILTSVMLLITVCIYFFLPEGRRADASLSLKPQAVMSNFLTVLKQHQFLIYAFAGGIATAAPFAFIAGSSDVFINLYHTTEQEYGWIFTIVASAIIGSTQLNHILLKKYKSQQIVKVTLIVQTFVGAIMVFGTMNGWYDKYGLVAIMFVFLIGQGLTGPNGTALALAPFTRLTGSAAAIQGSIRMGVGGLVSAAVSALHNNTAVPMVGMMALCGLAGLIILGVGKGTVRYRARKRQVEERPSVMM
ncbi:MAG TPA: multidrug effflux MFS transporter [Ohtaekwangia sp.]|uniref:multidrug effflux MFS transporter n=1 Tax=Ohtaekwangia sp. TaxID=2066019 RepID=UPI002F932E27